MDNLFIGGPVASVASVGWIRHQPPSTFGDAKIVVYGALLIHPTRAKKLSFLKKLSFW